MVVWRRTESEVKRLMSSAWTAATRSKNARNGACKQSIPRNLFAKKVGGAVCPRRTRRLGWPNASVAAWHAQEQSPYWWAYRLARNVRHTRHGALLATWLLLLAATSAARLRRTADRPDTR